jgi:alpha-glucosidase
MLYGRLMHNVLFLAATWDDLRSSIISIMDFNLFGVPMIGADICGFNGNTNEELCARWIEVGAFYPFSRDHNAIDQIPQELFVWDSVAEAARQSLSMRYQLLPFLYSLFYQASTSGAMVVRALWANFPTDSITSNIERQFMLGNGVLVSPVLEQGASAVDAYFPAGNWYRFGLWQADSVVDNNAVISSSTGVWKTLSTPLTSTNVHVRGGSVLPLQQSALTTTAARRTPFTLVAALCMHNKAFGSLFWDDGEQLELSSYLTADYSAEATGSNTGYFSASVSQHNGYEDGLQVQDVVIVGTVLSAPNKASINGVALSSSQIVFDASRSSLRFTNLNIKLSASFKLEWF